MTSSRRHRNTHRYCLLCGDLNPKSLRLQFLVKEKGGVRAVFYAHQLYQGYNGMLHGGVIASLLDEAMTHCLFDRGIQAVTADLQVRYMHAVPCHQFIEVQAELIDQRSPLFRLRSELLLDECVLARGYAKFIQRKALI